MVSGGSTGAEASARGRVLLVDPHRLVRECMSIALLQHGYRVVGEAGGGRQALALLEETAPDVVLIQIDLLAESGLALCQAIGRRSPAVPVIALIADESPQVVFQAVLAGVAGFVARTRPLGTLLANLEAVLRGESLIDRMAQEVARQWLQPLEGMQGLGPLSSLTHREREVARLVSAGKSNREIAEILFISPRTARNHVINIINKLGASSRAEVAALVARHAPEG